MKIYFDPKLVSKANFKTLVKRYDTVEFITDPKRAKEAEVLIPFNPNLVLDINIADYPNLKWIQYFSAGFNEVNLDHIKDSGIVFSNAQNVYSKAIAEDVFTKILYFNRSVKHYVDMMNTKTWQAAQTHIELLNSTVLILGVGSIGRELAKRFKAFEMNVIGYRKNYRVEDNFDSIITLNTELEAALRIADYVILALPLNDDTLYMFDHSKISLMKQDALLINVARGKVVNQDDLYQALQTKQIRGAGLDVFDPEPLPSNHPLWTLDNVFITPHNASSSNFLMDNLYQLLNSNLDLYIQGKSVKYRIV